MKEKENLTSNFLKWIELSQNALNLNITDLQKVFYDYKLCIQTNVEQEEKDTMVDVQLSEATKLSCHFVEEDICDTCFLYLDNLSDPEIDEYIYCLNNTYDYDFIRGGWILSDCYISVKGVEGSYYLMFYKPFK